MQTEKSNVTRKKFAGWLGVLSLFAMLGAAFRIRKNKKIETVKMLTQDGQLVEVDAKLLAASRKKISDKELQDWVKNRN